MSNGPGVVANGQNAWRMGSTSLSSLGMSLGPVVGGWIFDTYNNYAWLFVASAGVAIGAVMLALLFPKPAGVVAHAH